MEGRLCGQSAIAGGDRASAASGATLRHTVRTVALREECPARVYAVLIRGKCVDGAGCGAGLAYAGIAWVFRRLRDFDLLWEGEGAPKADKETRSVVNQKRDGRGMAAAGANCPLKKGLVGRATKGEEGMRVEGCGKASDDAGRPAIHGIWCAVAVLGRF